MEKGISCFIPSFLPPIIIIQLVCIAAFKNIRSLNLRGNQFSRSLPVSLFALPQMKSLDLSNNNFEGHFPTSLSSEPIQLEVLYLESNMLSGALPTERGTQ